MFIITLSKLINQNLVGCFDQSRVRYMFLVFPVYQCLAFVGIAVVFFAFKAVGTSLYFLPIGLFLAFLVGVPIFASWHLSCLLFGIGYFGFLAWVGIPLMCPLSRELGRAVDWFRPKQ